MKRKPWERRSDYQRSGPEKRNTTGKTKKKQAQLIYLLETEANSNEIDKRKLSKKKKQALKVNKRKSPKKKKQMCCLNVFHNQAKKQQANIIYPPKPET